MASVPFFGGDLPDFCGQTTGDVVAFLLGNHTHTTFLGDTAGCGIGYGLGNPKPPKPKGIEPEAGGGFAGPGHEALPVPGQSEPEAAIIFLSFHQAYAADELIWFGF